MAHTYQLHHPINVPKTINELGSILQGTVGHRGLFTAVYLGWPGCVHDAQVFTNSSLYQREQQNNLLHNKSVVLNRSNVLLVLLGDPAPTSMAYESIFEQWSSHIQKLYNFWLSKAWVVAYGRLKG